MDIEIRLLGPIEVSVGGSLVHIGGRRPLTILAALTLDVGHAVPTDRLIDDVWGEAVPRAVEADLQSHISRIRAALHEDVIQARGHTYTLTLDPGCVDAVRFERALLEAEEVLPADAKRALVLADQALSVWRGEPFGHLSDLPFLQPAARRLLEMRTAALEIRLQAEIETGRLSRAIPQLQSMVVDNPYRERLWYLLSTALARDGRRVEALRSLQRVAHVLEEVGLTPSADLRRLEQMIIDEVPPHVPRLTSRSASAGSGL